MDKYELANNSLMVGCFDHDIEFSFSIKAENFLIVGMSTKILHHVGALFLSFSAV
jgi:hypothetical protein